MGVLRTLGGTSSALLRVTAYLFARWIPGRFGPYALPLFFALNAYATYFVTAAVPRRPSTPQDAALVPADEPPSFADVLKEGPPTSDSAVFEQHPHVKPDPDAAAVVPSSSPSSPAGSLSKRQKKARKRLANDPLALTSHSDSDPGSPALTRRQKLPRNRPLPKVTLSQLVNNLVFGTPTPTSRFLNWISFAVNGVIFGLMMDAIFSPIYAMDEQSLAFARVGAITHDSVKLVARIPSTSSLVPAADAAVTPIFAGVVPANNSDPATDAFLPEDEFVGAKVVYRPTKPLGKWMYGPEIHTHEDHDWVATVKLDGLWAATEYEYRLMRPSIETATHPAFPRSQFFTTFSDPSLSAVGPASEGTHYTFASSSCLKPGFPYAGPHKKSETAGAKQFLKIAERLGVRFMVFLGDFIYADVPYFAGNGVDQFQKRYRQTFASPEVKALVEKVPMVGIFDDHEIYNDYSANASSPSYAPAMQAYHEYVGAANYDPVEPGVHYYNFRVGDSAFFVWDTRSYRSDNANDDDDVKTMLGDRQREAFLDWAAKVNQTVTWKFIVSSVPVMSLWSHGEDTWASFLTERDAILDVLEHVPNVIVLSGDRHEFAAASLRTTVTEFSTSPFNMFYLPVRTLSQKHSRGATGEDTLLQYLPDGNTKVTTFEVDTRVLNKPVVRVRVWIDGAEAWHVDVLGQPIARPGALTIVDGAVGSLGKGLRELLTFLRRSWWN
ncbi:hypothetical protein JCM8208_007035 [Rhodotorula glutinis]